MPEHQRPVLVYDRIQKNCRNTIALLVFVPVLVFPFAAGIVVHLLPWLLFSDLLPQQLLREHPLRYELLGTIIAAGIVAGIMTVATLQTAWRYRFATLRAIGATPLTREEEPDLWRIVENLCIGAGLPQPRLYFVDSAVPNAFATGPDSAHASLGITRGLLRLLQPRELEGVIAHELSHIGNQDTRLNTAVAAVIVTLRFPIGIVTGIYRFLATQPGLGIVFLLGFFGFVGLMSVMSAISVGFFASLGVPQWMLWKQVFTTVAPWYVLLGAPATGLFIRQAISRQREFLADADAVLLTRDPEGLAFALAKIEAWSGPRTLNIGPAAAHICIADPSPRETPWWDTIFPCHPPMRDRIDLLSRMGNGISESALQAAAETGAKAGLPAVSPKQAEKLNHRIRVRGWEPIDTAPASVDNPEPAVSTQVTHSGTTSLYEKPDGWSKVLLDLPEGAVVTLGGIEGNFLKVTTADRVVGYISQSARGHVIAQET